MEPAHDQRSRQDEAGADLDPAVGRRSCAIRRGMSKKRATAIFDLSLRVGPWSCERPALPKEWGLRNARKDAKGVERCGLGGPSHIARPDIGQPPPWRHCNVAPDATPLPKEWGPRNTRKDAKGVERCGLGGPCHIARPDIGRGRDALLRDPAWHVQKTVQRQYLTCPSEFVRRIVLCVLRGLLCRFSLLSSRSASTVRPSS